VVTPRRTAPKTGRFLEILGHHNPLRHERVLKGERIKYWLSQGAQPSARVQNMLISEGIIEGGKVAVHKAAKKKEEVAAPEGGEPRPDLSGREGSTEEAKETSKVEEGDVEAKETAEVKEGEVETKETSEAKEESPAIAEEKPVEEEASVEEETSTEETKETPATVEGGEETPTPESGEEKKKEPATEE